MTPTTNQKSNRGTKVLVVLGMHRSGTSAVMGAFHKLGIALGRKLLPKRADNSAGFWENKAVVALNQSILELLDQNWHQVLPLPDKWDKQPEIQAKTAELAELLHKETDQSPLWGVKDPRLCRLLPLWQPVLADQGFQTVYCLTLRHPIEVTASLAKRDGFSQTKGLLLWLDHVLSAERHTRKNTRAWVNYQTLLQEPTTTVTRLAKQLELPWATLDQAQTAAITQFLDPALQNQKRDQGEGSSQKLVTICVELFEKLTHAPEAPATRKALNQAQRDWHHAVDMLGDWVRDQDAFRVAAQDEIDSARRAHAARDEVAASQRTEQERLQSEISHLMAQLREAANNQVGREAVLDERLNEIELARKHIDDLGKQIEVAKSIHDDQSHQIQKSREAHVQKDLQLEQARKSIESLQSQIEIAAQVHEEKERQIASALENMTLLETQIASARKVQESKDQQIEQAREGFTILQAEIQTARENYTILREEMDTAREHIHQLAGDIETAREGHALKDQQLEQARHNIATLQANIETARQGLTSKDQQLEQARRNISLLQADIQTARQGHQSKDEQLEQARLNIGQLQVETENARANIDLLQAEIKKARGNLGAKDRIIEALQLERDHLQLALRDLQAQVANEINPLKDALARATAQIQSQTAEIDHARMVHDKKLAEIEGARQVHDQKEQQLCEARENISLLAEQIENARQAHQARDQIEAELRREIRALRQQSAPQDRAIIDPSLTPQTES